MRLGDEVDNFQRVPVPGKTTMKLEAHKYVVYYEGLTADEVVPPVEIAITGAKTGTPLAITPYGGSLTYSVSNHEGSALGTVTPSHAGVYAVRTDRNVRASGANVALGRSLTWPILRGILGTFVIGGAAGRLGRGLAHHHRRSPLSRTARTDLTTEPEPGSVTLTHLRGHQ
jgi:hypothetical protein